MTWVEAAKKQAALASAKHVESGQIIGLGSGSTAVHFIREVGRKLKTGKLSDILAVPTSYQASIDAVREGIKLTTLDEYPELDLAVDGADQLDAKLNVIKGGGAALLREKIIAASAKYYIIIADERKLAGTLGEGRTIPIEVLPFAIEPVTRRLTKMGGITKLRVGSGKLGPVVTDNGHFVVDAGFGEIRDPVVLDLELKKIPGVLETGLFLGYTDIAYIGTENGVKILEKKVST